MRPRQELTEIFSTFIQFEADRFSRWVRDARLHRNAQNYINQLATASISEDVLALCWHQTWQDPINPLPKLHLSAYLQEPCYWAAQQTQRKYTNPQYNGANYFQLAPSPSAISGNVRAGERYLRKITHQLNTDCLLP
jgi:hypothetical protein